VEPLPQVPAQAPEPGGLRRRVHGRAVGAAPGRPPDGRVRLEPLSRRRATVRAVGDLRRRPRRPAARSAAGVDDRQMTSEGLPRVEGRAVNRASEEASMTDNRRRATGMIGLAVLMVALAALPPTIAEAAKG